MYAFGLYEWSKLASDVKLSNAQVEGMVRRMASALPDLAADVARRARADGLDPRAVRACADSLSERARRVDV